MGNFRVPLCLYFKASLSVKPFLWSDFDLHENETACRNYLHFEIEAQGNSEMAFCFYIYINI